MNLKKYRKLIIFSIIFVVAITIGAVVYNVKLNNENIGNTITQDTMKVKLYFIKDKDNNSTLKEEERIISKGRNSKQDITSNTLQALISGPKNQTYKKSIPNNISILGVELKGSTANVNLSKEYNELKPTDSLFCRAALVFTLTDLDFISNVRILIEGSNLLKADGEEVGPISREDIVIGDEIVSPDLFQIQTIKLYFSNIDVTELIIEEREIEIPLQQNQIKAKIIMEQLIAGPKNSELLSTIPPETKIRDIKIKDGICYLDLSREFVDKHSGGSTSEFITIESIVMSLTEISEIKKVQFLIAGETQQEFKGHIDFSKPFERSEYYNE